MEFLQDFLPILIYILLIIILVIGIILGINFIKTMKKVEKVVDDVNEKVESLNGFFKLIDFTTDRIVEVNDRIVEKLTKIMGYAINFCKAKAKKSKIMKEEE